MIFIIIIVVIVAALMLYGTYVQKQNFLKADNGENILYTKVTIMDKRTKQLIGADNKNNQVNYMALNKDKQVYFPTSANPDERYYILNVTFDQQYSQSVQTKGRMGSALVGGVLLGGVGAVIGASRGRKSTVTTTENTSDCYIQVVDKDMKDAHTWVFRAKSAFANELAGRYMLNDMDLQQLSAKAEKLVDESKQEK